VNTQGAYVHEVGGTETHMHVCVTVPPTIMVSELIGQLKGGSAYEVNEKIGLRSKRLQWQTGYGVVSFGEKALPWVKAYVRDQQKHHASGTIHERLERIAGAAEGSKPQRRETP
jgi:putative transposase